MVIEYLPILEQKDNKIFTDVNTDHWAYTAINSLKKSWSYQRTRRRKLWHR